MSCFAIILKKAHRIVFYAEKAAKGKEEYAEHRKTSSAYSSFPFAAFSA